MHKGVLYVLWPTTLVVVGFFAWRRGGPAAPSTAPAPSSETPRAPETPAVSDLFNLSPFQPLPLTTAFDRRKVVLGDQLFHEKRLSSDGTISCATCHDLERGGADDQRYSVGIGGTVGELNTPTVLNGGFNFRHFWDGRAGSLEEQVNGPIQHPGEMGSRWEDIITMLERDASYSRSFSDIYPDGVTAENLRDAVATFERSLITPNSRFDRHLRGEPDALTMQELEGYRLFTEMGCVTCHQGINVGGNMFQVLGRMGDYFTDRGDVKQVDYGRFNVTGDERDRYKFKVPSLRNVELTAPYLHDGSAETLEEAVQVMARYQMGQELRDGELTNLVAFLRTLTGESVHRP